VGRAEQREAQAGVGKRWAAAAAGLRAEKRKEEGFYSLFFQFLSKAILKARIQIEFKLEFKSNHSKN